MRLYLSLASPSMNVKNIVALVLVAVVVGLVAMVALWPEKDPRELILGAWEEPRYHVYARVSEDEIVFSFPDGRSPRRVGYRLLVDQSPCEIELLDSSGRRLYIAEIEFEGDDRAETTAAGSGPRLPLIGAWRGTWYRLNESQ